MQVCETQISRIISAKIQIKSVFELVLTAFNSVFFF